MICGMEFLEEAEKDMKILIIEDDAGLNRGISFALEQEGYETFGARSLGEGYGLFEREKPDAVILDLNLPDGDGISFCKRIRSRHDAGAKCAVLMLTARDLETDEIMGLSSGADDYITKPFSVAVLKVRLRNILRRRAADQNVGGTAEHTIVSGDIVLDLKTFRVSCGGKEMELSMTEFRLLQYFMEHKNQALLKEQILGYVWDEGGAYVEENTLSVNVSRLRRKLGKDRIRTIQGIGYLWEEV